MTTFEISEDTRRLVTEAEGDVALAQSFKIVSNDGYITAAEILKSIKGRYQEIETKRKEMTLPLDEAKRRIMDFFRQPLEQLSGAERQIKAAMVMFTQEQERVRREEEERIQALAREEQERLDKSAMEGISQAQKEGSLDEAERILEAVVQVPVPIVVSEKPKVQGIKTVTRWKHKVIDEALIPREYLIPNEKLLADTAIRTKGEIKIPGVEFYSEALVASIGR